jgi:hypothetical protein
MIRQNTERIKCTSPQFFQLFCMGMKLGTHFQGETLAKGVLE